MIKEFVEAWHKNKDILQEAIEKDMTINSCDYKYLVKLLFDYVINPYMDKTREKYNTDDIYVIDDGDYQGTKIFILHEDKYQPTVNSYVYTDSYYGSCSGCDTLLRIQDYEDDKLPTEEQVKNYMILCMHLLESCKYMGDRVLKCLF